MISSHSGEFMRRSGICMQPFWMDLIGLSLQSFKVPASLPGVDPAILRGSGPLYCRPYARVRFVTFASCFRGIRVCHDRGLPHIKFIYIAAEFYGYAIGIKGVDGMDEAMVDHL